MTAIDLPKTFEEATLHSEWRLAMEDEMTALLDNDAWTLGPPPANKHVVGCRWVYTIKHKLKLDF